MRKKNYEVWPSLLAFVTSFAKYKVIKDLHELSSHDIECFARMYYLEHA